MFLWRMVDPFSPSPPHALSFSIGLTCVRSSFTLGIMLVCMEWNMAESQTWGKHGKLNGRQPPSLTKMEKRWKLPQRCIFGSFLARFQMRVNFHLVFHFSPCQLLAVFYSMQTQHDPHFTRIITLSLQSISLPLFWGLLGSFLFLPILSLSHT